jgi:hypothetical protein
VKLVADCRLAFRTEGPEVVVYLADLHTMADAVVLARLNREALVASATLFDEIKTAYQRWLQEQVAVYTGVVPRMVEQVPPEPPEGHA